MDFVNSLPRSGTVAVLNNHSGGGHVSVVNHLKDDLADKRPLLHITTPDAVNVGLTPCIGNLVHSTFNKMQKNGDIKGINHGLTTQWVHNYVVLPMIVAGFFFMMLFRGVDHIITPQPIGIKGMILAARILNFFRSIFMPCKAPIKVSMVLTELPTKDTENFFYNIRQLSHADRKIFQLVTTRPLLKDDETEADFWEKNTGLPMENVFYDEMPIRKAFTDYRGTDMRPDLSLKSLSITVEKNEVASLQKALPEMPPIEGNQARLPINPADEVFMVMLGSQANKQATIEYTEQTIQYADEATTENQYLFVFCGRNQGEESLYQEIVKIAQKNKEQQKNRLTIVPLAFQSADTIASILARSNGSVTECGGLTAMELTEIKPSHPFIHAQEGTTPLRERMLRWGLGNARHMEQNIGAKIVSPPNLAEALRNRA